MIQEEVTELLARYKLCKNQLAAQDPGWEPWGIKQEQVMKIIQPSETDRQQVHHLPPGTVATT